MRRLLLLAGWLTAALATLSIDALPKGRWVEIQTPHFTLLGDAPESAIVAVGQDLERLRSVLTQVSRLDLNAPTPTTIFVFKNAERMRPYLHFTATGKTQAVDGAFFRNPHSNFILVNGEHPRNVRRLIYHEYVHFFAGYNFPPVPLWFEEGLAELYSTFEADEEYAYLGKVVSEHLAWLRTQPWIPLDQLVAVDYQSAIYNENQRKGAFYSQSWVLVHYLFHGHADGSSVLHKLLNNLRISDRDRAFQDALGGSYGEIEAALKRYVRQKIHLSQQLPIGKIDLARIRTRKLSRAETLSFVGDLLAVQDHRRDEADVHFRAALDRQPRFAHPWRGLGLSAERDGDFLAATGHYDRALSLAPDDGLLRALSLRARLRSGEDRRLVRRGLERLVSRHPDLPIAWRLLAATYTQVDSAEAAEGIPAFKRALELAPEHLELAKTLFKLYLFLDRGDDARKLEASYFHPRGLDARKLLNGSSPAPRRK